MYHYKSLCSVYFRSRNMHLVLIIIATRLVLSKAVLQKAPQMQEFETEEDMLRAYMTEGYTYDKILLCLSLYHGLTWSIRKLKQCYREMWRLLQRKYKFVVARNNVMETLRRLDPHGNAKRKSRRLQRRIYISDGPNFTWHMDCFDKLKRYGFKESNVVRSMCH